MTTSEELREKLRRAKSFGVSGYTRDGHEVVTTVHLIYEDGEFELVELNDELRAVVLEFKRVTP